MTIRMDALIQVAAQALDMVEIAYIGVSTNHGKRIAALCAAMGRRLGLGETDVSDLMSCALLHDNALTEFLLLQQGREEDAQYLGLHCELGQRNAGSVPFRGDVGGFILYHHERADGLGPFKKFEGEYPLGAELIAAADTLDAGHHLQRVPPEELQAVREGIAADIHRRFTARAGEALLETLDEEMLASLRDDRIGETAARAAPVWTLDAEDPALIPIAELIAHIIDFKSVFTRKHTQQIANRAWKMAEHYGYGPGEKTLLYLSAALHDLGKLGIPSEVLEKPGKLTSDEFEIIKNHIVYTRRILEGVEGLGPITEWASNHHEKLDASGYPMGRNGGDLDFNSRLMACIDIYQAVSEERPYHPRRSHAETMPILYNMAERGGIDPAIVKDLDMAMAPWSGRDVEGPPVR